VKKGSEDQCTSGLLKDLQNGLDGMQPQAVQTGDRIDQRIEGVEEIFERPQSFHQKGLLRV